MIFVETSLRGTSRTGVFNKIGGGSAIQINLIALALHNLYKTSLLKELLPIVAAVLPAVVGKLGFDLLAACRLLAFALGALGVARRDRKSVV